MTELNDNVAEKEENIQNEAQEENGISEINPLIPILVVIGIIISVFIFNNVKTSFEYNQFLKEYKNNEITTLEALNKIDNLVKKRPNNDEYRKYQNEIKVKYQKELDEEIYRTSISKGDRYFKEKNYNEAIINYETAYHIKNTPELKAKIDNIKNIQKQKLAVLKASMRFKHDNIENITWIFDKTSPRYTNANTFHIYIGKGQTNKWLRLRVTYFGNNWIFWDTMIFNIDGEKFEFSFPYGAVEHDNNTMVWEYLDTNYDDYKELVKRVANSKKTIMRLQGNQHHHDKVITEAEKQAIKRILEYYENI